MINFIKNFFNSSKGKTELKVPEITINLRVTGTLEIKGDLYRNNDERFKPMAISKGDEGNSATLLERKLTDAVSEQQLTNFKLQFKGQNTVSGLGQETD